MQLQQSAENNLVIQNVIGCAIEVHRHLGPGMLESAYQHCLFYELVNSGFQVSASVPMPIIYKDLNLEYGYKLDLLVNNFLVLELKAVENFAPVHFAQLLTYMRLGSFNVGLLINFNVTVLKNGIRRLVL